MQNSIMYHILKSKLIPHFNQFGEREQAEGKNAYRVEWEIVGQCNSLVHAKQLGFICPVLELINK